MIEMIREIREALKNNMPRAALALSLMLPDICGQIEYPNEKVAGKRYVDWLAKYLPQNAFDVNSNVTRHNNANNLLFAKINPQAIYKLRCTILHSGNAEIEKYNQISKSNHLDALIFTSIGEMDWTDENGCGAKSGYASYIEKSPAQDEKRTLVLEPKHFCETICGAAEQYYNSHSNQKAFDNHSLVFCEFSQNQ